MKPTYTVKESSGSQYVERVDADGSIWSIPCDPANSDYQRYLEQQAKQTTTESSN